MPNSLHTIFCHKCGKAMTYPYEQRGELYHKECLPVNIDNQLKFAVAEYDKYLDREVYNPSVDEAIQQPWSVL